ncbi:hypothetical protein [Streptomyces sp. NPDC088760]|uniref:hypothetical protein n=1 Tax=Streptomyces sp. NPDC088760 TaxID=3365890 RepID=UPI00380B6D10
MTGPGGDSQIVASVADSPRTSLTGERARLGGVDGRGTAYSSDRAPPLRTAREPLESPETSFY